ncbi:hypothetical protein CDAR_622661 [Caerostris darwini]|uniref:Secreted protein n=1 Tax=Caerostris darwini TaxID=1538125 RepID=A0AAV4Q662_9ARAC|nr:hypothetical protein CDAR_622661 [Caerostris darwini]
MPRIAAKGMSSRTSLIYRRSINPFASNSLCTVLLLTIISLASARVLNSGDSSTIRSIASSCVDESAPCVLPPTSCRLFVGYTLPVFRSLSSTLWITLASGNDVMDSDENTP